MPSLPDDPSPDAQQAVDVVGTVHAEFAAWRAAHPQATFAEMQAAVEAPLSRLRAPLITDTLPAPADATAAAAPPVPPRGATGAVPRERRGDHRRSLRVVGDQPVTLERPYWACTCCGEGRFPPG